MQLVGRLPVVAAAAVAAICLLALATHRAEAAELEAAGKPGFAAGFGLFKLPKLFDFDYYQERFGKKYASLQEALVRKTYYMARALRAYVSGMNFKWRKSDYFLGVNHLSDSSPEELERRRNKVMAEKSRASLESNKSKASDSNGELPDFLAARGENVEEELRKLAEANPDKPGYRELLEASSAANRRRKRAAESAQKTRDFSFDQLMKPGVHEPVPETAKVAAKVRNDLPSNNPFYQQPEVATRGLDDDHEELLAWPISETRPIDSQLKSSLDGLTNGVYLSDSDENKKDVMYFDHRDFDCLTTPRNQGDCGSCYAFAAIAYTEWLYCTKTDWVIPFSEQYMVDCGMGRFNNTMRGCDGATDYAVLKFIQNFGMERLKIYPYVQKDGQCPYDENQSVKEAGYVRMKLDAAAIVPVSRWAEYIKYGPLFTGISSPADYNEYAGGVHDGHNCGPTPDHAQLVVGHGREDGKDFWLLRNSYGPKWGDGGYFKLSKSAPERCIEDQRGLAFGTKDAIKYDVEPHKNEINKRPERVSGSKQDGV